MTGAVVAPEWIMARLSDDEAFELWAQARERSVLVSIEQGSLSGRWIAHVDGLDVHARAEAVASPYDAAREALERVTPADSPHAAPATQPLAGSERRGTFGLRRATG